MPKFSIVIPVYNVEKYIGKCLESIKKQTFKDYEIIVVDDGSDDNSMKIVKKYDTKIINSSHVGVSEARNIGAKHAKGEYLIFLDSDDYWDKDLLKELTKSMDNNPDLIRFQARTVNDEGIMNDYNEIEFYDKIGEEAFNIISQFHYIESVWIYAIKRSYYSKEKFAFKKDTIHEDFGLTPLIIIKAGKVNCINYVGYNYYRRSGSIMNTPDYEWTKRKVKDFYTHYTYLRKEISKTNLQQDVFKSFIANSMLMKICELNKEDYKDYLNKLKKDKVANDLLYDSLGRRIKKIIVKISPSLYYKKLSK
jgi:glycosyltransferase involved in cell wall biosynthesis